MGSMFLVVVETHIKWLEVISMTTASAEKTIGVLHTLFVSYCLPQKLVMFQQWASVYCQQF